MSAYIGTSGWAYKEWKPDFYPQDLPQRAFLEHYAKVMTACEVNATFRRLQSDETMERWRGAAPAGFLYSMKAHRGLTHSKRLTPTEDKTSLFDAFLASVGKLDDKLGVILWQFPPYRKRDDEDLGGLLDKLRGGPRFALEFRDDSWDHPEVEACIAAAGGTVCISETEGEVPPRFPDGPFAYVRLRAERYTEKNREGWRDLISRTGADKDVFAFTKHEGIPAGDPLGGVGMAVWLVEALRD